MKNLKHDSVRPRYRVGDLVGYRDKAWTITGIDDDGTVRIVRNKPEWTYVDPRMLTDPPAEEATT